MNDQCFFFFPQFCDVAQVVIIIEKNIYLAKFDYIQNMKVKIAEAHFHKSWQIFRIFFVFFLSNFFFKKNTRNL